MRHAADLGARAASLSGADVESDVEWLQVLQLPLRMAHALQVIRSADALARRGHRVRLYARVGHEARTDAVAHALDAALGRAAARTLDVHVLAAHKGAAGIELRARCAAFALRARGRQAWIARERGFALFALGVARALRSRAALVYELHNLEHVLAEEAGDARAAAARLRDERRIAARAHALVAISQPLLDDATSTLAPRALPRLVPDGVDLAAFAQLDSRPLQGRAPLRLAYAGSLYAHKGVATLLELLESLARDAGPRAYELCIAGGEPASELERLRARAALLARDGLALELAGALDPRAVPGFLARADLVVLPAGSESRAQRYTSPLKLFEALACGVPIVAAPSAAHASVLEHARTAWLARDCSAAALAEAVRGAVADPARSLALARAARVEAQRYTWERRAELLELALQDALALAAQ